MPINILHIRDTFEIGGPGKTILETIGHINSERFKLHVAVFLGHNEKPDTPFIREAQKRNYNMHIIRSFNQYDPRIISRVLSLVKKLNIDIIHSHEGLSDIIGYIVSKLCKVSIITTLHGWIEYGVKDRIKVSLDKKVIKKYDMVIAVSETILREMTDFGVLPERLKLLYNGIVVKNYNSKGGIKGYLSEVTGIKIDGLIIATIGRLSSEKGQKDFIVAAANIIRKGYKVNFALIGDGPERDNYKRMIVELGLESNILLTGYLKDIKRVFIDIDLMVLPSYTEGLPNVVLESLLMNVPVIATRVGGTPEIIKDNETGALVNAGSPEQISSKVIEYLNNPEKYNIMTTVGKSLVKNKFNFIERTKKLEIIYNELMNSKSGS